jgi:hypothetical protein
VMLGLATLALFAPSGGPRERRNASAKASSSNVSPRVA